MRVTSSLWVAALVRRYNGAGLPAVLQRRGAEEAGAIFIVLDRLDGTSDLYGPAPQSVFNESHPRDRAFQRVISAGSGLDVAERIQQEMKFDPDLWVVAVEDPRAAVFFDLSSGD